MYVGSNRDIDINCQKVGYPPRGSKRMMDIQFIVLEF